MRRLPWEVIHQKNDPTVSRKPLTPYIKEEKLDEMPKILSLLLMILLLSTGYAFAAPSQTLKIAAGDPEDSEMGVVGNAILRNTSKKDRKVTSRSSASTAASLGDESECLRQRAEGTLPWRWPESQPRAFEKNIAC